MWHHWQHYVQSKVAERRLIRIIAGLILCLLPFQASGLLAMGTYSEGWAVIQIIRLEQSGLFYNSFEGKLRWASYDEDEECNEKEDQCFTPISVERKFSARPEEKKLISFLKNNEGREMLIHYKIHRFEPVALSSNFEVLEAFVWKDNPSNDTPLKMAIPRSGKLRAFTLYGRILRLEYKGTVIGTYEGLYLDQKRRKVHPFSITDENMAEYAKKVIRGRRSYHMAVSQAYVATVRDSDFDIYAINYKRAPIE